MEQEERISNEDLLGRRNRRRCVIGFFVATTLLMVSRSVSLSSRVFLATHTSSSIAAEAKDLDLSIALRLNSVSNEKDKAHGAPSVVPVGLAAAPRTSLVQQQQSSEKSASFKSGQDTCFPFNSHAWLNAERIQNAPDLDLESSFQILQPPRATDKPPQYQEALENTLCLQGSLLLATNQTVDSEPNDKVLRAWTTRVVYLAVTFHQHYQAWEEFNHRRNSFTTEKCRASWETFHLSPTDFECPKAKFLVIALGDNG